MTQATQPVSGFRPCPHCGQPHPASAAFCPKTGRALSPALRQSQWLWPVLGGLGLLLMAAGIALSARYGQPGVMALATAAPTTAAPFTSTPSATPPPAATRPPPSPTATQTPLPSTTPTATETLPPTATPCTYTGRFAEVWNSVRATLGCPQGNEVSGSAGAAQVTASGRLYWVGATRQIYAFGSNGTWIGVADQWVEGNPTYSCDAGRRAGFVRGFGRAWCDNVAFQALLGSARGAEYAVGVSLMNFENGFILRAEGVTRVAYSTGVWESR